jgi:hypothetical protein
MARKVCVGRERESKRRNASTSHYDVTSHAGTAEDLAGLMIFVDARCDLRPLEGAIGIDGRLVGACMLLQLSAGRVLDPGAPFLTGPHHPGPMLWDHTEKPHSSEPTK